MIDKFRRLFSGRVEQEMDKDEIDLLELIVKGCTRQCPFGIIMKKMFNHIESKEKSEKYLKDKIKELERKR
ncbi:MAG: hypothetical protein ACW98W_14135 [Candidatus Hodarchaeales archaeon]|jgi:hypothetical protein